MSISREDATTFELKGNYDKSKSKLTKIIQKKIYRKDTFLMYFHTFFPLKNIPSVKNNFCHSKVTQSANCTT